MENQNHSFSTNDIQLAPIGKECCWLFYNGKAPTHQANMIASKHVFTRELGSIVVSIPRRGEPVFFSS